MVSIKLFVELLLYIILLILIVRRSNSHNFRIERYTFLKVVSRYLFPISNSPLDPRYKYLKIFLNYGLLLVRNLRRIILIYGLIYLGIKLSRHFLSVHWVVIFLLMLTLRVI